MFQSEFFDLNGIFNRKILTIISDSLKSESIDKNTSLNQFIPLGDHLSEIIDWKKNMVYKIKVFFHSLQN